MDSEADDLPEVPRKPARPGRSKYADREYEVGKGKPPRRHQFKPGNAGGGRKKGSRNRTDFEKLMNERVLVGEDRLGRPIRKRMAYVIDRKLMQLALSGELGAIRLVKEVQLKQAAKTRDADVPTAADLAKEAAEQAERQALSARLVGLLDEMAAAKRANGPKHVYRNGKIVIEDAPPDGDPGGDEPEA